MPRQPLGVLLGLLIVAGAVVAQEGVQRAKIKKLDLDKMLLTLRVAGKDRAFALTADTRVLDASGKTLKERLRGFTEGTDVLFKAGQKDGKEVLVGLKRMDAGPNRPGARVRITPDTSKLKPLTELGADLYETQPGGLYPEGKNDRPAAHEAAGRALANEVQPRDAEGKPAKDGKIVLLSIGMSNTMQASTGFQSLLKADKEVNPHLVFVNGAQGGMTAQATQDPATSSGERYWSTVDQRLKDAGVSRAQVQAVWIKQADAGPSEGFPGYARKLQRELGAIVRVLHDRFPNLKLAYLSSRTYGGYAVTRLNPEPYAYESGFAVKWLIAQQIKGDAQLNFDAKNGVVKAPWLSWGPYLWANGNRKRADGFHYEESDFTPADGTHESPSGMRKTGGLLLQFLKTDATAKPWFLGAK